MNTTRVLKGFLRACLPALYRSALRCAALFAWAALLAVPGYAASVSPKQARLAAERWLAACPAPLGAQLVKTKAAADVVAKVEPLKSAKGRVTGYVVSLDPEGYLILSSDTRIRPVIAFSPTGTYDPDPKNDLAALLSLDLPARHAAVRGPRPSKTPRGAKADPAAAKTAKASTEITENETAWSGLLASGSKASGVDIVTEEWVPHFVMSTWGQGAVGGRACFNYYTPLIGDSSYTFDPGNPDNIVCGCVATATAQIIRYFEWPQAGIGYKLGGCGITFRDETSVPPGVSISHQLRGGNGNGGPYDWAAMTLAPNGSESEHSLQQIGALCFDAGLSVGMSYNIQNSNMSGSNFSPGSFRNFFNYAGASGGGSYNDMRANFDAGRPVALTIGMTSPLVELGGHAIVGHGYGRVDGRWYYRFEMGSGGVWYNLEEYFYTGTTEWAGVGVDVYNIYQQALQPNEDAANGKILSGRITDAAGNPVPGVHVKIQRLGSDFLRMMPWNDTTRDYTDERGIWAIDKVPTALAPYTIVLTKPGLEFSGPFEVASISGNQWGLNFIATGNQALTLQDWWYDYNNLVTGAGVVVLEFNRPIGAVAVDPTKLVVSTLGPPAANRALTGGTVYQADGSSYVWIVLNAGDTSAIQAMVGSLRLTMARAFLVADVDGQGTQGGEDDTATVPVAPLITTPQAENTGTPVDPAAPQVAEVRPVEGGALIAASDSPHLTNASPIQFAARFSAPVSGVDASDFRLRVTNSFVDADGDPASPLSIPAKPDTPVPGAVITAVQPVAADYVTPAASPSAYWLVTVDVGPGDGYIRLDVLDDDSITNGTPLGGTGARNGDFLYSPYAYHVDNLGPVIVGATLAADDTYVTITWNEPVGGTDSLNKTADIDDLPNTYRYLDTSGNGQPNLGEPLWLDRGATPDDKFNRAYDRSIYEAPNEPGLQENTIRTGTLNSLVSGFFSRFYYVDSDGAAGFTSGDKLWVGVFATGPTDTFGGSDVPVLNSPATGDLGTRVSDSVMYYSASGAPGGMPDQAWFLAFLVGSYNGIWEDFSAPDSRYNAAVDTLVLGTAPAENATGIALPSTAMFRDTNSNGVLNSTDLIWVDTGSVPNALDGSDNRLDGTQPALPGILFSIDLEVIFHKNDGTLSSVGISSITNGDGTPMTQGQSVIRAYLKYTPDLDLGGTTPPDFLNEYRVPIGVETIEIVPLADSVFDALGNAADPQTTTGEMKLYDSSVPRVVSVVLDDDNYGARVIFSERVYTNTSGVANHNPMAIEQAQGNLKAADFQVTVRDSANTVLYTVPLQNYEVSQTLGTNVCYLDFNAYRANIDPGLVVPSLNRAVIRVRVLANQVYDVRGNAVPDSDTDPVSTLIMRPVFPDYDPDSLPPTYFNSEADYYRAADAGYSDNTPDNTWGLLDAGPPPVYGTHAVKPGSGLDHHGIYYRDLDGDCRVDAVDLNFRNPLPGSVATPLTLSGVSGSLFRAWVQNNDPQETANAPATEGLPNTNAWPFTADWTQVTVTGASVLSNSYYYSTVRVTINQAQVRARTHGKRWVLITYTDPTPGSDGLAPYKNAADETYTDDREKDQIYWYWNNPDSNQSDYFYIVDTFGPVMAWDGAPARPISAAMWRVANYLKEGEGDFSSYDYMDVVFSEPLSSVNTGWSPGPSSGVHEKDGPYGPEIIDLLTGDGQTVRLWYNGNYVTSHGFSGSNCAADRSPSANSTPSFSGMAITVRNLDSRYRLVGFREDEGVSAGVWVDMIQMNAEGAQIVNGSTTHTLQANRITLHGYDQGGFNPNSDAYWRRNDGSIFPMAGFTDHSLGDNQISRTFSAAARDDRVTPGDAFLGAASELVIRNTNLNSNSILPALYTMKAPATTLSGPVYAMVKVNPIVYWQATSRLDEQERAVLGIDAVGRDTDVIDSITLRLVDTSYGQFDPAVDLLPLADDATSGVRLYKMGVGLVQLAAGGLEWSDWRINDEGHPYREVVLRPLVGQTAPRDDAGGNSAYEYEIRVVTSVDFALGDSFYAEVPDNGILFRRARSSDDLATGWDTQDGTPGWALTDHVYLDANRDQRWGMGETIVDSEYLVSINGRRVHDVPFYDAGVPYAHLTQDRNLLSAIRNFQRNMYYAKRGTAPNPDTTPEPPGAIGGATDTDYNVAYSPGDDVWYDIGGKLGVYDAGVDIPVVSNTDLFRIPWSPHEEGGRSVQVRGAVPATVSAISGAATVSAGSLPTAVLGIDLHDSGRTFGPRYTFGIAYGFVVEAVSKNLAGGTYTNAIAYVAAAKTLAWRGGAPVNVAAAGRYLLPDASNSTFIVVSVWDGADGDTDPDLPAANATATLVVSSDTERDVQQPAAIRGVRIHALGPGNVPGNQGILRLSGSNLSWQSNAAAGGTQGAAVDVSEGGMFVLSAERTAEDYLVVQVDQAHGASSETLPIYSADGRNITPFQDITGLEIVAVSSPIDQGTYRFTYDGTGSLSWADGDPTAVSGSPGTQTIVPGNDDGTAFVVVRRTAEQLPDAATEDYLFINQARLLRLDLSVNNITGFTSTHLAPLTAGPDSGIALFRDANANGVFDGPDVDEFVPLLQAPVFGGVGTYTCSLTPDPTARAPHLPNSHVAPAVGNDYFVTVRTTYDISYGDSFGVSASVYEPTEPNASGAPSFAGGYSGTVRCTSVTNTIYNDATRTPWTVDAGTPGQAAPVALFGVDHFLGVADTVYLQSLAFTLHSVNGFIPDDDLMAMDDANPALRGVLLYADNGNGTFGGGDTLIPCDIITAYDDVTGTYTFTLLPTAIGPSSQVPAFSDGGLSDHFVCINLSPDIDYGDEFYCTVEVDDIYYSTGVGNAASRLVTHSLAATITSRYNDLTSRVQVTPTAGLVINDIGSAVTDGYHQVSLSFDPASLIYTLTWNGFSVTVDPTQVGTYTLGNGNNTLTVTFDPRAFFREDVLVDGDGTATPAVGLPETVLGTPLRPLQDSSAAGGVAGNVYYVDVDLNTQYTVGIDAIILAGNAGLVYNAGTDSVILGTPVGGVLVAPPNGAPLLPFVPADCLAYWDRTGDARYTNTEDIVSDTDGVYTLPWMDQVLDTDGDATTGIGPGSLIAEDAGLVDASTVSVGAGSPVPGFGAIYFFDADGSVRFSRGDDIIVRPAVGGVILGPLTFNPVTDQIVFDGDDNWDGDEVPPPPESEVQVTPGAALSQFAPEDYVAFEQGGAVAGGYEQREDIFRSYNGVYNSPAFDWTFRVTNGTRKVRRYEPAAPVPFRDPEDAMTAMIGLDIANSGATDVTLDRLTVRFWNINQFNATTDLRVLANDNTSGVLLYRDADGNGVFDPLVDWRMPLAQVPAWTSNGNEYRLTLVPAQFNRVDDESIDGVYDFFVVVQPDQDANNWQLTDSGDQFYAYINAGDLVLSKAVNVVNVQSDTVTIDSLPPQLTAQADINDADGDGYLDSLVFTFHENLQPNNEDAGDWVLTDADGTTNLSPTDASQLQLSGNLRTLTVALDDIAGTTGRITYRTLYDGDGFGLFDWAGNPVDFTAAGLLTADDVPPIIVSSAIIIDPAWTTIAGTPGVQNGVYFHDRNNNGVWDAGEDIFQDLNGNGQYDLGVDRRLWDGGDAWTTADGYSQWVLQTGMYFEDVDGDGVLGPGENLWVDRGTGAALGVYTPAADVQVFVRRGEEVEYLDLDGNGRLDTLRLTFSEAVRDSTLSGFTNFWANIPSTTWFLAGRTNVEVDPNGPGAGSLTEQNNNLLYLTFDEATAGTYDTDLTPDLTVIGEQLRDMNGNRLNGGLNYSSAALVEDDQAPPVLVAARGNAAIATGNIPAGTRITLTFSERMTAYTALDLNDFTTDPDGPLGPALPASPAFNGVSASLSIDGSGNAVITLNAATTSGNWTENCTISVTPGRADHCVGDGDGHNMREGTTPVQIRGLGSILVLEVLTLDTNSNGYIDAMRITFDRPVRDNTLAGYVNPNTLINVALYGDHWQVAGRAGTVFIDPNGPLNNDPIDNTILYLVFSPEAASPDTGARPALTVAPTCSLRSFDNEPVDPASVPATSDGAAPQIMDVATNDQDGNGNVDIARLTFSENINDATVVANDFTIGGKAGAFIDRILVRTSSYNLPTDRTTFTTVVRHGLEAGDVVEMPALPGPVPTLFAVLTVPSTTTFTVTGDLTATVPVPTYAIIQPNNDEILFVSTADGDQATGTAYQTVAYTRDAPADADTADLAGNLLPNTANAGLRERADFAVPIVVSARTTADNAVAVTFSEPVTSIDLGKVSANRTEAIGNPLLAIAFSAFGNPPAPNAVVAFTGASATWNTGATGTDPDAAAGTNSLGVARSPTKPDLYFLAGAVVDQSARANPIAAVLFTDVDDGAAPVVISATSLDADQNGAVDTADLIFSERVTSPEPGLFSLEGVPATGLDDSTDYVFRLTVADPPGVPGTDYAEVSYAPRLLPPPPVYCTDIPGNRLATGANLGLTRIDGAEPVLMSARTLDDRTVFVTFSEPLENSANQISAAAAAGQFDLDAGGTLSYGQSLRDNGLGTLVTTNGAGDLASFFLRMADATTWNTDATGTAAGSGYDSAGTQQATLPQVHIAGSTLTDAIDAGVTAGNALANAAFTGTTDGAPPVVLLVGVAAGQENSIFGAEENIFVKVFFSEALTYSSAGGVPTIELLVTDIATASAPCTGLEAAGDALQRVLSFTYTVADGHNRIYPVPGYLEYPDPLTSLKFNGADVEDLSPATNPADSLLPVVDPDPDLTRSLAQAKVEVDTLPPEISAVRTMDHNTVEVTFSEPVKAASLNAAIAAGQITLSGAQTYEAVSADAGNATPLVNGQNYTIVYLHVATAAKRWNTDATGSSAGAAGSTDEAGVARANRPSVNVVDGVLEDRPGNLMAATAFTATTDGARPVITAAGYREVIPANGSVDRVLVLFSEPIDLDAAVSTWTLTPNDLALNGPAGLASPSLSADGMTLTLTVAALALETGVDNPLPETEPAVTVPAAAVSDRAPANNALAPVTRSLADQAGPAIVAAAVVMPSVIEVTFSEKLAAATVLATDFAVSGNTVSAIAPVNGWAGARLTVGTLLGLTSAPTVAFAAAAVVTDPETNPNLQTAAVAAAALSVRLQLTAPPTDRIYVGSTPVDVEGLINLAVADLTGWQLFFAEGHSPLEAEPGWASLATGAVPVAPAAKLGDFTPNIHADNPATLNWSAVLRVTFADGNPLDLVRFLIVAASLPQVGTVNDGLTPPDIDFQQSTGSISGNWTGVGVAGVPTDHYEVAVGTASLGFDVVPWTPVGLVASRTLTGLTLTNGVKYYFSVEAKDAAGAVIAIKSSDGVIVDAALPTPGSVRDGAVAGSDLTWQASDSAVAANWNGFADPGAPTTGSGIASYEWAIFRQAGGAPAPASDPQELAWTNVGNVTAAATDLGAGALDHAQLYYAGVRAVDAVANVGTPAYSDGFRPDLVAPIGGIVRDGLAGPDIDITATTTSLSGNWDAFAEPDSGLFTYQYRAVTDVSLITAGWLQKALPAQGALNQGRTRFGVARLPDGRLMAIGGWTGVAALATVEVYSPATGAWTFTGSLVQARYSAAVAVLPDGDVIVAGGSNGSAYLKTIERFNHFTSSWSQIAAPGLSIARENAAAAVMADGSVWVAGGRGATGDPLLAPPANLGYSVQVDRVDPATNTAAAIGVLSQPRAGAAAYRLASGRLVVFGGETPRIGTSSTDPSAATDIYTPGTGWSTTAMAAPRHSFGHAQLPDGDLLALGGITTAGKTAAAERFDTATNTWAAVAPMSTARANFGAAWIESTGTVLAAGGINAASAFVNTCEEYNPDNDAWTASASLNRNRGYHAVVSCSNGLVMAFGGLADWLITGETEVRRFAAPISAWANTTATSATIGSLVLELGRTYYFQVRAFDNVGNRSEIVTSDGVTVSSFSTPPVIVTLTGPSSVAVGELFNVLVYVREDNADANGFRGGPLDINFTPSRAQVSVEGGFSPPAVLNPQFRALGDALTSGTLNNAIGLIDELGGATLANDLGEGPAPGVLYATIPFRATSAGVCTIAAGPGQSGLVLTPPIGVVPTDATDYGAPLNVVVLQGVTLSVDGGVVSVNEGGSYRVRATLTAAATEPVTVVLGYGGTATNGTDYTVTGLPLVIGTGATSAYVTVQVANDGAAEVNETIVVRIDNVLSGSGGYTEVDEQSTTVTVVDSGRPGDADGDGDVDYYDLLELISEYGKTNPGPNDLDSDFDGDGDVDYYDLLILIANYGSGSKGAGAAAVANAGTPADAKVGPTATVSLVGPATVAPNATFNVDLYVQISEPAGFGGGPLDIDFTTSRVDYSGAFNPATIIQPPFNSIATSGTLNEAGGQITELGGATIAGGHGYGAPVLYARMTFRATATGTATFTASAGTVELRYIGGIIPFANTTYGSPLTVTIASANHTPTAADVTVQTALDQAVDITLSGTDLDGDTLTFNLPTLGQPGYPANGELSNSRPGGLPNTRLVTYTPDPGSSGPDSFTYTVSDASSTSPAATVSITVGGFLTDIAVARGGSPYAALRIGMQPGASDSFILAEGDYLAAPAGIGGAEAYLLAPYGEYLARDIRGVVDSALWKLVVAVPAGTKETWSLAWQPATLPDLHVCTLTPADAAWQPTGAAVDMTTASGQALVNSTGSLKVFRFLILVARKHSLALALEQGWNLVGLPLTLDAASRDLVFGDARVLGIYQYASSSGYTIPTDFTPGRAYWLYANAAFTLDLLGLPVSGGIALDYGWNLVAPYTDSPNPMDGVSVIAVWAWDPSLGYYIPDLGDPLAILSTMGVWIFATEDTVIWDDGR